MIDLAVYRTARLAEAATVAAHAVEEANAAAAEAVDAACRMAAATLAEARSEGTAQAERELNLARGRQRRSARALVLAAQRSAYTLLGERVRAATLELRTDPRYEALLGRLEALAREQLGEGARIERDPKGIGGVVAEAGGRRVDYSLPALADRSIAGLGAEVERLWA